MYYVEVYYIYYVEVLTIMYELSSCMYSIDHLENCLHNVSIRFHPKTFASSNGKQLGDLMIK